jgi:NDP-sugar pyrophosphorylase family protein
MTDLIRDCLNIGVKVNAFPIHEYWTDIGTPEDLERVRKRFAQNEILS